MTTAAITRLTSTEGLLAAVRAACSVLFAAPDEVSAVTLAGSLEPGSTALPLLARAETLAREFGCRVQLSLGENRYEIRFSRARATANRP